jgi:anti-sigma B factor antagonist
MKATPYDIDIVSGNDPKVFLSGEIDYAASLELESVTHEVTSQCGSELLIDLGDVTFIDSEGIKTLINIFKLMQNKGGAARIVRSSPFVNKVLKLAGAYDMLISEMITTPGGSQ